MHNFPGVVRQIREGLNLNQKAFSAMLGVKQNTVSQYETGDATPSMEVLIRLHGVAPPGKWKDAIHDRLISMVKSVQSNYPELDEDIAKDVVQLLTSGDALLAQLPPTETRTQHSQLMRFARLVSAIAVAATPLDDSISDILEQWTTYGDRSTAAVFRDGALFLKAWNEISAGANSIIESPKLAETLRKAAADARHLAMKLLRHAEVAERALQQSKYNFRRRDSTNRSRKRFQK